MKEATFCEILCSLLISLVTYLKSRAGGGRPNSGFWCCREYYSLFDPLMGIMRDSLTKIPRSVNASHSSLVSVRTVQRMVDNHFRLLPLLTNEEVYRHEIKD